MHHLVGSYEIQRMLRVGRQRAHQLTSGADFPEPTVILARGKVWHREDVENWARSKGRAIHDD